MPLSELALLVGRSPSIVAYDQWSGYRQLLLPRQVLLDGLRPACGMPRVPKGTTIMLNGGIVHARPP
jgi:hypothetical protein